MAVRVESNAEPIPGYRLLERLGGGGFGEVWRAVAPGGLHKAIKFVYGDLSNASDQRAEQELKSLKRVQSVRHPYILSLERYDIVDGQLLIVMELADRNLWDRYKECRAAGRPGIPREELLRYLEETAEALDLMNGEYQLQHLDIKPQNLFLVHQHVKVADFGLVKDLEGSQASVTGGVTPVYAAPETFEGNITRYSDQYSLAIVFQELLTGQRPFQGSNIRQLVLQHMQGVPNLAALPLADQPLIGRALSKVPSERFPTCRALVAALRAATVSMDAGGPSSVEQAGPSYQPPRPSDSSHEVLPHQERGSEQRPSSLLASCSAQASPNSPSWQATPPPSSGPPTAHLKGPAAETGSAQGTTHCLRALDPAILKAPEDGAFRSPPEIHGPGTLFPAVVIGLGALGMAVLQRLREHLHSQVAPLAQLPHLRFLLIDTDPDVIRTATCGSPNAALTANEVLLTQLNRPSYYLKPRDGRPPLESWLNPRIVYRIPRSQVTTGVRALGRLAFLDNYRTILRRVQLELEAALDTPTLNSAASASQQGIRSNRPRVYLITGLAGGTGSGMFIDVAYTLRALLRQMGYETPEVVGLLLAPPVDSSRTRLMPLGNTYAALTELNHFGSPGVVFQALYHERETPVREAGPPFSRSILMPLPDESDEVATQEVVELCGQFLYRDLTTPLGKVADLQRAGLPSPPWEMRGQYYQTFGMYQLTWPRISLLQVVARRLCQRLVQRWMSKDSKPLREAAQTWVQEQWEYFDLGPEHFIDRLQAALVKELGKPPELLFKELISPLTGGSSQGAGSADGVSSGGNANEAPRTPPRAGFLRRGEAATISPESVREVLNALEEQLGKPSDEHPAENPPQLPLLLRQYADRLGSEWSQKLAELSVCLIEAPTFRLAGAEEAIRQLVVTIEQVLGAHEPLARDLAAKAAEIHGRLLACCAPVKSGQRRTPAAEVVEWLRGYAKGRFQALLLQHLTGAFVGLRGHLSDELREVNFCRVRLGELLRSLEETPAGEQGSGVGRQGSIGRQLFVSGCKGLAEAVELFMEGITAEHLLELDARMEEMLKSNFQALVHVCLTSANILKHVESLMLETARDYAAEHLPPTSVAQLFLDSHASAEEAEHDLADFHDQAAPELTASRSARSGPPVVEVVVLAAPEDEAGATVRKLFAQTAPDKEVCAAASTDDLLVYRERGNLPLADLEQLGPVGHDAYAQMCTTENFTPHSRCDIDFRQRK
jgi:serine/threonine protein kinase